MNIKEFQQKAVDIIEKIDNKHKGSHDTDTTLIHLLEEFGEIAREIYNEKIGRDKINIENLKEELGDVLLLLAKLADNFNIDLEEGINKKLKVLKDRYKLK